MTINYIVDTREHDIKKLFVENGVPFTEKQLDLGDMLILYSKGEISNTFEPVNESANKLLRKQAPVEETHTIVIERKSFKDLKSSMSDGRYREQKSRYIKLAPWSMYYIFENNDPKFKELGRAQYMGAYIHTVVRDHIPVLLTNSKKETYDFLIKIGDTLEKFGMDGIATKDPRESQIKKKKAVGIDVYKQQLCCIPGISSKKAELIASVYSNMISLISALKQDVFKVKGIGKVLHQNIKDSILLNTEDSTPELLFE